MASIVDATLGWNSKCICIAPAKLIFAWRWHAHQHPHSRRLFEFPRKFPQMKINTAPICEVAVDASFCHHHCGLVHHFAGQSLYIVMATFCDACVCVYFPTTFECRVAVVETGATDSFKRGLYCSHCLWNEGVEAIAPLTTQSNAMNSTLWNLFDGGETWHLRTLQRSVRFMRCV